MSLTKKLNDFIANGVDTVKKDYRYYKLGKKQEYDNEYKKADEELRKKNIDRLKG